MRNPPHGGQQIMKSPSAPIDPATIHEKDKVKLIALYARVCPSDVLAQRLDQLKKIG